MKFWGVCRSALLAIAACGSGEGPEMVGGDTGMGTGTGEGNGSPPNPIDRDEACRSVPGCAEPENAVEGPERLVWRVHVIKDETGQVSIRTLETFRYPEAFERPPSPATGEVALMAYDAQGQTVDVAFVRFPTTLEGESVGLRGGVRSSAPLASGDAIAYLLADASVERIALLGAGDVVLDERAVPPPEDALDPNIDRTSSGLVPAFPSGPCAHVQIIEGWRDLLYFPVALHDEYEPMEVSPLQLATIRAGLGRLTPLLCAGVRRVAIVKGLDEDVLGAVAFRAGDIVMLNGDEDWPGFDDYGFDDESLALSEMRAWLQYVIAHEAAHTVEALLDVDKDSDWTRANQGATPRRLADETSGYMRLGSGLGWEWGRIHESFRSAGLAGHYVDWEVPGAPTEEDVWSFSAEQVTEHGVMSPYGATNFGEDFAEFVAYPLMREVLFDAGITQGGSAGQVQDRACLRMREHQELTLPGALAAAYTKLAFVRDLGAIEDRHFAACAGPEIGIDQHRIGTTIRRQGVTLRHYGGDPTAVIGSTDQSWVFDYTVEGVSSFGGSTYPGRLRLTLRLAGLDEVDSVEEVSWPRGLYLIRPGSPAAFSLRLDGAAAGNFDVIDGIAVITEANNDTIRGAVSVTLVERRQAPFPEHYDPPVQFRFLLRN